VVCAFPQLLSGVSPRLRFDLFDSCARYKFSSFIHSPAGLQCLDVASPGCGFTGVTQAMPRQGSLNSTAGPPITDYNANTHRRHDSTVELSCVGVASSSAVCIEFATSWRQSARVSTSLNSLSTTKSSCVVSAV